MNKEYFLKQLTDVTNAYELVARNAQYKDLSGEPVQVISSIISQSKAAVARITGVNSEYYKDIENALQSTKGNSNGSFKLLQVIGIVYALKEDVTRGYLKSLYDVVQSEVFSDYIDMAEHLLQQGYKDPAAVIAGSTLEAHLKELAKSNSIELQVNDKQKKASLLNDELAKNSVYSSAYQKQVTAWLGIRNDAAHGNYDKYTPEQVGLMIQGIRLFTLK